MSTPPDIVKFIHSHYREIFDSEVNKRGFLIASRTSDISLLQLLLDAGCDISCQGQPFPPLHSFADYNNLIGMKFLIEHGIDIHIKNKLKQTALDRAKLYNNLEAVELLKVNGAR